MPKHDDANAALLVDDPTDAYTHAADTCAWNSAWGCSGTAKVAMVIVYSRGAEG